MSHKCKNYNYRHFDESLSSEAHYSEPPICAVRLSQLLFSELGFPRN